MKSTIHIFLLCLLLTVELFSQTNITYEISFDNAVHHEADISVEFKNIDMDTLSVRMSRTSPGRYAIHEFAKNVYGVKAVDAKGNPLDVSSPNPYQWDISGYDGTVRISYTLFANHGDGTYSQIDETHAHLNVPATFMYAPGFRHSPLQVKFRTRDDLNWKVATQLKLSGENRYFAPDLDYFMDSPIEISDHQVRSFKVSSGTKDYEINFVLHQDKEYEGFDEYMEKVKKIVAEEMEVFGELPDFDFGSYYFLACYLANVDGDGMEHRNSTICTSKSPLSKGGSDQNIGTVAHEFFHSWNVERIRPASLEPFDYTEANMSGELWFAEGFTSYYTKLILCRAGIISKEAFANGLAGVLGYVWNAPGRAFFSPVEMSYKAPFVDAATAVDQVNWENIFISYYSYGNVLGLALDLSLRNLNQEKDLDGFMSLVWSTYGKNEKPYTLTDLKNTLAGYAGGSFSSHFFNSYIYGSDMPDYGSLLHAVGVGFSDKYEKRPALGAGIRQVENKWLITSNPQKGSSLYMAGLSKGDRIISIDGKLTNDKLDPSVFLDAYEAGQTVKVVYNRYGTQKEIGMLLTRNHAFRTYLMDDVSKSTLKKQKDWLGKKSK